MTTTNRISGRVWAYIGAILGGTVSIAANIAHSFIPPIGASAEWSPETGAVLSATFWPVSLFVAIEILARTPWPKAIGSHMVRWIGLPPVVLVAAFVSYRHLSGLLAHYGEDTLVVYLGPLAVDGLMGMATGALIATSPHRTQSHISTADTASAVTTSTPPVPPVEPAATAPAARRTPAKKATPRKAAAPKNSTTPRKAATPKPDVATDPVTAAVPASRRSTPAAPAATPAPSTLDSSVSTVDAAPSPAPAPALVTRARHLADQHLAATGNQITPEKLAEQLRLDDFVAGQLHTALGLPAARPRTAVTAANGTPVQNSPS